MTDSTRSAPKFAQFSASRPWATTAVVLTWVAAVVLPLCHNIPNPGRALAPFMLVVVLAGCYSIFLRGVERLRLAAAPGQHQDVLTTWTLAAALLLPPVWSALAIAAVYALWVPTWRGVRLWRATFVIATTVVAGYLGHWVFASSGHGLAALALAGLVTILAQAALVAVVMLLSGAAEAARASFSSPLNWFVNLSTGAVGAGLVVVVQSRAWWALPVVLVAKFLLQWLAQYLQLQSGDAIDRDTELLGAETFTRLADQLMRTTERWTVVLLQPVDPSRLSTVASVAQLVCSDGEYGGRLGDQVALVVKGPRIIARNLGVRVQADLEALGVDCAVGAGTGDSVDEQIEMARADAALSFALR